MTDAPESLPALPISEVSESEEVHFKPGRREWRSLWLVMGVQTLNALNDKFAQYILIALSAVFFTVELEAEEFVHKVSLMLSLPFVLFAPLAGWISDRFSKRTVILACLYVQLAVLVWIAFALQSGKFWTATWGFFMLAVQSAFFSPAKIGIVKELVGSKKLAMASGIAQMLTILAIIAGAFFGGFAFKHYYEIGNPMWESAGYPLFIMCGIAFFAIFAGWAVLKTPSRNPGALTPASLVRHFVHLGELLRDRRLRLTALGISYFWFAGLLVTLITIEVAGDVVSGKEAKAWVNSIMLAFSGLGIAVGSGLVALVSKNRIELGIVPVGGLGMAATSLLAAFLPASEAVIDPFNVNLFFLGIFSAMFLVPLNAVLQDMVLPEKRGRMLSASGLMDSVAGLLAIGVQWMFLNAGFSPMIQFSLLGAMTLAAALYVVRLLPQNFIRFMVLMVLRVVYRIRPVNARVLPESGGAMLVANHLSYIDAFIISAASDRLVRFVIFDHYMSVKWMKPFLKLFGVVPISPTRAKDAIRTVADAVKGGDLVCIFPEGQLTRSGVMNEIKKGFQLMVRQADAPVIPVYIDSLWGSIFSFERGLFFKKWPYHLSYHLSVHFGEPLKPKEATSNRVREVLMDLSAQAMEQRHELTIPVEVALLRALRRRPWRTALVEYARVPRRLKRSSVFASGLELAKKWRKSLPADQPRIGVLLPNSSTCALVNLGLRLAGRVPVNIAIEKTFSADAMREAMEKIGVRTVISTPKLQELLGTHYWPENVLDMGTELRFKTSGLWWTRLAAWLLPRCFDWKLARVDRKLHDPDSAAVAWLCDEGDGQPIFTELSHRDLLANIEKLGEINAYRDGDALYSEPQYSDTEGTILSLWYPFFRGMPAIMVPASADATKLRAAIAAERITWIIAGPITEKHLLSGNALPDPSPVRILQSFRPLTQETVERLAAVTGLQICPCSASNRMGGLISISIPDPNADTVTAQHQPGALPDAVGRILPGTTARVVAEPPPDDATWEVISSSSEDLTDNGYIVLRGAGLNVNAHSDRCTHFLKGKFDVNGFLIPDQGPPTN